jgi:hypothetical protein
MGFASFSVGMVLLTMTGCKGWLMNPGTTDHAMLSQPSFSQPSGEKVDRSTTSSSEPLPKGGVQSEQVLLTGSTVVIGTVTGIRGNQIEVKYEDSLQPRFLPLSQAKEKGMKVAVGEMVEIVFNEQNVLVDFHPLGPVEGEHKIIAGVIDQSMPVAQERVVIRTGKHETKSFFVRPLARSKMASMPIGVDAVFLADETGAIIDVTFGSEEGVKQASREYSHMSQPKSAHTRIDDVVFESFAKDTITIETAAGKKKTYQVRPLLEGELKDFTRGERLTLLIDSDHYVIDVAKPQRHKK